MSPVQKTRSNFTKRACPPPARLARLICMLVFAILLAARPGFAATTYQAEPSLTITDLSLQEFPLIRITVDPKHLGGATDSAMNPSELTVLEDEKELEPREMQANYQGIHLALAINTNIELDRRDGEGVSHYEKLVSAFKQLAPAMTPGAGDHFSLFINPDTNYTQLTDPDSLIIALDGYQNEFRSQKASLDSLTFAIDALNMDTSDQDKLLLYITPMPALADVAGIESLTESVQANDISVHIWLVGEANPLEFSQGRALLELAEASGGSFFSFTGSEAIPDPTDYLVGLGYTYQISYLSSIRESGQHTLALRLDSAQIGSLTSPVLEFQLKVLPIQPNLSGLPEQLQVQTGENNSYSPDQLPIEATFSFPDGYPRTIVSASLWVNGELLQQNTQAPYGSFLVDLKQYPESQTLSFQVKVIDELDLEGSSPLQKVDLEILPPPKTLSNSWYSSGWFLAILAAALLFILIVFILPRRKKNKLIPRHPDASEEITANLPPLSMSIATLSRLDKDNLPYPEKPIPIMDEITLIGRDPTLCQLVFDDPALEPLHAQLRRTPDGEFFLTDFNSTAGTWVNYAPIGPDGIHLQHGDLVHLGSQTYRFSSSTRTMNAKKAPEQPSSTDTASNEDATLY